MFLQISMRTMTLSTSAPPARTGPAGSSRPSSSCLPALPASPSSWSSPCCCASSSARCWIVSSLSPVSIPCSGGRRQRVTEGGGGRGQHRHHLHLAPVGAGACGDLAPSHGGHWGGHGQHGQAGYGQCSWLSWPDPCADAGLVVSVPASGSVLSNYPLLISADRQINNTSGNILGIFYLSWKKTS